MKNDLYIQTNITIPSNELEITASKAGGPGGQHANKTSTRISVRWNIKNTRALDDLQKERVMQKLHSQVTSEGDLIVHYGATRSQEHNRKMALANLAALIRKALRVPKQRKPTQLSKVEKEKRLHEKKQRSDIKKTRDKKFDYD